MSQTRLPTIADFADAEHCVLEDVTSQNPTIAPESLAPRPASQIRDAMEIHDRLRGRKTSVRIFEEGWIDIVFEERKSERTRHRIDPRYLYPVPLTRRYYPVRVFKAAGVLAGLTALCAVPAIFGWLANYFVPAALAGVGLTLTTLFVAYYLTHEKIAFRTLHGRAATIRFSAGLGSIRRFRKLIPKLVDAIAAAADSVHDDIAVFLRAEMREHYRLRAEGILTAEQCADSTGRILGKFDGRR